MLDCTFEGEIAGGFGGAASQENGEAAAESVFSRFMASATTKRTRPAIAPPAFQPERMAGYCAH